MGKVIDMFNGVLSGTLVRDPRTGSTKTGKVMSNALVAVQCENGDDKILASVIAFESTAETLSRLSKGDGVAVTGPIRLTHWVDGDGIEKHGVACTASSIMSAYERRKKAPPGKPKAKPKMDEWAALYGESEDDDLDA